MASSLKYLEKYKREVPLIALAFGDKDPRWTHEYFFLIRRLLKDLALDADDPRFALTLTDSGLTSFIIGKRVVAEPGRDQNIRLMMPMDFDHEQYNSASILGYYTTNGVKDAKLIDVFLAVQFGIPGAYDAWKQACEAALISSTHSAQIVEVHPLSNQAASPTLHPETLSHVDNPSNLSPLKLQNSPILNNFSNSHGFSRQQSASLPQNSAILQNSPILQNTSKPLNHSQLLYLLVSNDEAWSEWMLWNELEENVFHYN
ncbi:hypothetical protein MD537_06720 [Flavihumibacter sediminis]|nr:hypothetical protein [Flavihumibacter sediminis]